MSTRTAVARKYRQEGLRGIARSAVRRVRGSADGQARVEAPDLMRGVVEWLASREAFSIVQIGAYVGDSRNDPLSSFLRSQKGRDRRTVVVLVEPVRTHFDALVRNYEDLPFARFENVAVADRPGTRDFYRLGVDPVEHGFPEWLAQLGSLRADRMTHLWDAYEREPRLRDFYLAHRVVDRVRCVTLHELLDQHAIAELDLLQIDAEGYDYEILRTLDFERVRPRLVNYERVLLGADEAACRALMVQAGYLLFDWGQDTLCLRVA